MSTVNLFLVLGIKPTQRKVFCWDKADTTALREHTKKELQSFSNAETINSPINSLWNKFKLIILNGQEKFVPSKTTSKRFNQPWFNRKCKQATRKKIRRYQVFKRYKSEFNWKIYQEAARTCRRTCNASREYMFKELSQKMEKTPRKNFMHLSNTKNKASQEFHHCIINTAKLKLTMKKLQKY